MPLSGADTINSANKKMLLYIVAGSIIISAILLSATGTLTRVYIPRHACMQEDWMLITVNLLSNLMYFVAYMAIPFKLLKIRAESDEKFNGAGYILYWFAVFIIFCGLSHVWDIISVWWAAYRLFNIMKFAGGVVSMVTAFWVLGKVGAYIKQMPSQKRMDALILSNALLLKECDELKIFKAKHAL